MGRRGRSHYLVEGRAVLPRTLEQTAKFSFLCQRPRIPVISEIWENFTGTIAMKNNMAVMG
jgi:hypothetical protein